MEAYLLLMAAIRNNDTGMVKLAKWKIRLLNMGVTYE
jgi:hypothetical protein